MRMLKRNVPLWALLVAIITCSSVVIGALIVSQQVNMTLNIKYKGMQVLQADGTTLLETIDLGDFYGGDTKRFPTEYSYFVKNTGAVPIYVKYDVVDLPAGCSITIFLNDVQLTEAAIHATAIPAGVSAPMYFTWQVAEGAEVGIYNPALTFSAYDSPTG